MRHIILTLFMMIAAGVFGFVEGRDWTQSQKVLVAHLVETSQPQVVLAKSGTRQLKETRQQNEGCPVIPNADLSQPKPAEQESSLMRGLVF